MAHEYTCEPLGSHHFVHKRRSAGAIACPGPPFTALYFITPVGGGAPLRMAATACAQIRHINRYVHEQYNRLGAGALLPVKIKLLLAYLVGGIINRNQV